MCDELKGYGILSPVLLSLFQVEALIHHLLFRLRSTTSSREPQRPSRARAIGKSNRKGERRGTETWKKEEGTEIKPAKEIQEK